MSIDERLRMGLGAGSAPDPYPSLDGRADLVVKRGRRRRAVRRTGTTLAAIAVVAIVALAIPRLTDRSDGAGPAGTSPPPPSLGRAPSPLIGTFRLTVPPGAPGAAEVGAVGQWVLVIDGNREASLTRVGHDLVLSHAFVAPQTVTLNVAPCGAGPGHYAWGQYGSVMRFAQVDDPCPLRAYLLHGPGRGHVWHVVDGT